MISKGIPSNRLGTGIQDNQIIQRKKNNHRLTMMKEFKKAYDNQKYCRCPFCGSSNVLYHEVSPNYHWVRCMNCSAAGPKATNKSDAIRFWNRFRELYGDDY